MGQEWRLCCWGFLVISMLQGLLRCHGCWEEERLALLRLQPFLHSWDWDKYDSRSDCCGWYYVHCDNSTGYITQLHLSDSTNVVYGDQRYYLNASLFLPFQHLTTLDLSYNAIAGCLENEGFERLSRLRNLQHLDLRGNYFNSSILASLQNVSSLASLNLTDNILNGSLPIHVLNSLKSLTELELSGNSIENFQPSKGAELLNLPKLEYIDLSFNHLNTNVISSLRGLSSLKVLDLSGNILEGSIHVKEFHGLSNLEDLYMQSMKPSENIVAVGGSNILQFVGLFPSIKTLDISGNIFNESITGKEFHGLSNLEDLRMADIYPTENIVAVGGSNILQFVGLFPSIKTLDISRNILNGPITGKEMNALTNLEELHLDFSSIGANVFQAISALPSLQVLSMTRSPQIEAEYSRGSITKDQIFEGLCRLTKLRSLYISNWELSGTIPSCFSNLSSLEILILSNNQFSEDLAFSSLRSLNSLQYLDISDNQFRIPSSLAPFLNLSNLKAFLAHGNEIYSDHNVFNHFAPALQLNRLDLSGQGLATGFPKFLYYQHELMDVDLSNIDFGGEHFPYWLLENNTKLELLSLANSSLFGPLTLPAHSHNNLTKFSSLSVLDISDNNISGRIPLWISYQTTLAELNMSNNLLQGPLPSELSNLRSLQILDLSTNVISGTIPSHFNLPWIVHLYLFKNRINGTLPNSLCNLSQLITLDLSNNHLTGFLPKCIRKLQQLRFLILKENNFQNQIPVELCQLTRLSVVDLSYNNLFGSIPHCLSITSFASHRGYFESNEPIEFQTKGMSYFYVEEILLLFSGIDLSCNKFTGEIPKEIGSLNKIHVLNLSHNNLVGGIPLTISNLTQIESLDLSFNYLSGKIPPQIVGLTFLSFLNVSFNNLSGPTPKRLNQFGTFEESSYKGNPLLCGEPLQSCMLARPPMTNTEAPMDEAEDGAFMDMSIFYISFIASYVTSFLAVLVILWINPHWRHKWSYHLEMITTYCYYYVMDHFLCKCP